MTSRSVNEPTAPRLVPTGEPSSIVIRSEGTRMFQTPTNVSVTGGHFILVRNKGGHDPLEAVHRRVAANAVRAGQLGRVDDAAGRYPATRIDAVISGIEGWRAEQDSSTVPIFWLVGHAGTGKSAIMQRLADKWREQEVPHARFFFFRPDDTRNSPSSLVATLLHQLISFYPSLVYAAVVVLDTHVSIFSAEFEDQLAQFIVAPLREIQESSTSYSPPTILIDGLEDCVSDNEQDPRRILAVFDKVMAQHPCLFRLLVASRDEPQIQAAFSSMSTAFCSLSLDNIPGSEDDIRALVSDQIELIKRTHPHTTTNETWPSAQDEITNATTASHSKQLQNPKPIAAGLSARCCLIA